MKATDVRILRAPDPGESYIELRFLLVETTVDERGNIVTAIDHVTTDADEQKGWSVTSLARSVCAGHLAARKWAVAYAARHDVPVVYELDPSW